MRILTAQELRSWVSNGKQMLLLDVREEWEHTAYNIGGINIPLGDLMSRRSEVGGTVPVVVYCEKGIRSAIAIQRLEAYGFTDMYNLEGGMSAWKKAI